MPILGTVASQFAGKPFNSFESIATASVGSGGQATISFTSIPQTFKHLQIRSLARNNSTWMRSIMYFNNDSTASNYSTHGIQTTGDGGTGTSFYSANLSRVGGANQTQGAGGPGVSIIDIHDYTDTSKFKVVRAVMGFDANGSGQYQLASVLWRSTTPISQIDITDESGNSFTQYSHFALYGIRGA